jgi:hypothetical protein
MLNLQFAKSLRRQGPSALAHRDARRRHAPKDAQEVSSNLLWPANDDLPLIVTKAEEEVRSQLALKRMGYLKVLSAYLRYKRDGRDTFHGFGADHLWPTMDFVRDWLKDERRQFVAQHGWVSLLTLLATLAAGLAFVGVLTVFG